MKMKKKKTRKVKPRKKMTIIFLFFYFSSTATNFLNSFYFIRIQEEESRNERQEIGWTVNDR